MKTPAVPSKTLLRFLRSQTQSALHPTACVSLSGRCRTDSHSAPGKTKTKTFQRHLSTSERWQARPKSLQSLDEIWARPHEVYKALPPPRRYSPQTHPRHSSTKAGFFRRLLRGQGDPAQSNAEGELPFNNQSYEDTSAQLFNLSRALSRNPTGADLKLRCTEFDANGSVTLVSGEFKKSELIAKYGLLPRDMRKIDSSVLPHILVRPSAILINLLHLRVLIQSDRVLVFDAYGSTDSYTQSLFMYDLEGKLRQKADPRNGSTHLPYEFRALEAVLISVTSGLEAEFALVRDPVTHILKALEEDIDREKLRHLLIHSKKLGTFEQKARLVRDAIDDLLDADDDLAAMYLTERKKAGKPRPENDHQEVEMLLESYHKICDEIVEISGNLISNIRNTEEVVKAILDANRNQLMLLEIKFSVATLGIAGGTLTAGLYGMNLKNYMETSDWGFASITAVCVGLSAIICMYGMRKLRKMQKVRMWGEGIEGFGRDRQSISGRGNWRSEALEYHGQKHSQYAGRWKNGSSHHLGGGHANNGPVLWPGMEGLGMHKLNRSNNASESTSSTSSSSSSSHSTARVSAVNESSLNEHDLTSSFHSSATSESDRRSGECDTNSDADASSERESLVTIHDDLDGGRADIERRLAEESTRKTKVVVPVRNRGGKR